MMSKDADLQNWIKEFTDANGSLHLATVSKDGLPNASYAPFVQSGSDFYIMISGLATHTSNLFHTGDVSVMLVEDESTCDTIFARKRVTYQCKAHLVNKEDSLWTEAANLLENRFGELIQLLRRMPDFRIFKLTPLDGLAVIGFGKAYKIKEGKIENFPEGHDESNPHEQETSL